MQVKDRVVVITGASSGIGAALAQVLARRGAALALLARRAELLEEIARQIAASGHEALAVPVDIGDPRSAAKSGAGVRAGGARQGRT